MINHKKILKWLSFMIVHALISCIFCTFYAVADSSGTDLAAERYRYDPEGNWFYLGGRNQFRGESYNGTVADADRLKSTISTYDYICIYGNDCEVSEQDFEKYFDTDRFVFNFTSYCLRNTNKPIELFNQKFYEVYVYKPSYDDLKYNIDKGLAVPDFTIQELNSSSVIVDYSYAYAVSKKGKVLDEVNDNIPVWWETGYLKITSPIDVKVRALHIMELCYYDFYVKAGEPYMVKLKQGGYDVTEINGVPIDDEDQFLPFNNNIQIDSDKNTLENPYLLDLQEVIEERNVPSADKDTLMREDKISTDYNLYEDPEMSKVLVDEKTVKRRQRIGTIVLVVLLLLITVGGYGAYKLLSHWSQKKFEKEFLSPASDEGEDRKNE